jgi:hypothetical protein
MLLLQCYSITTRNKQEKANNNAIHQSLQYVSDIRYQKTEVLNMKGAIFGF